MPQLPSSLAQWTMAIWEWFDAAANARARPLEALDGIREGLRSTMETFAPVLADRTQRIHDLAQRLQTREREVLGAQEEARAEHERVTAELVRTQEAYRRLEADSENLRESLAGRERTLAESQRAALAQEQTTAELVRTQEAYQRLEAEAGALREALGGHEQTRAELTKTQEAYRRLESEAGDLRRALAVLEQTQAELTRTQEAYRRLEADMEAVRQALAVRERSLLEAEEGMRTRDAELERTRQDAEAQRKLAMEREQRRLEGAAALSAAQQHAARLQARLLEGEDGLRRMTADRDAVAEANGRALAGLEEARRSLEAETGEKTRALGELEQTRRLLEAMASEAEGLREERSRLLELHRSTEAELVRTQEAHAQLEGQAAQLRDERDARDRHFQEATASLAVVQARLEEGQALVERLEAEVHGHRKRESSLSTSLELSRNGLAAAREELEEARQTISRIGNQHDRAQHELALIYGSRSWRLTAPLRGAARLGRQVMGRPGSTLLLPAPAPPAPAAASEPLADPATTIPSRVEPAFEHRAHAQLRAYLAEEFGSVHADDIVQRIDRYRLPIPTEEVRAASLAACSESDAIAWLAGIARRASHRIDPGVEPEVSIVVPVYGQLAFTLACIDALVSHQTRHAFEILIGDDASPDATAAALAAVPVNGVRHVRHSSNLGFVRNCNATAALARGRYVVFLNNDTQVLPGWLDELIGTLRGNPGIGLAGSKLVYPDGRLQECGGIVWRDGSAWNFGRLDDPRRPEYCYLRDIDYVSGASIALPRSLWEELGGFDELFVPAYAEDVDLAFRVRARGLRTVVQPLSQLLHFEGISSGTDLGQGAKAYQVENLRKLHARWQEVLAGHRENADRPDLEKERDVGKRMLFVDLVTPTPNEDAGSLVVHEMMSAFRDCGFKVTFIPEDNFAHMGATTRDLQRVGIEAIYHPAYSSLPAFAGARRDPFDVILLVRFKVGEAHLEMLRKAYPSARILFSNCDLHYLREMREAELAGDAAAMAAARETKRREIAVIAGADLNLVHSEAELELLGKDAPSSPTVLFPLVHDPVAHCPPIDAREGTCFVGSYRHPPNADGITWFVEKVWPLVRKVLPDEKLYIAGSGMTDQVKALSRHPNVRVVGFVEDLELFLAQRRATIAPLRFGAGAKGKVASSLANGVPVVSTFVGAEGMQLTPGTNVLVADDEEGFAASLVEVLSSDRLWHQLSAAGLAYAARVTSRSAARERAQDICARLGVG